MLPPKYFSWCPARRKQSRTRDPTSMGAASTQKPGCRRESALEEARCAPSGAGPLYNIPSANDCYSTNSRNKPLARRSMWTWPPIDDQDPTHTFRINMRMRMTIGAIRNRARVPLLSGGRSAWRALPMAALRAANHRECETPKHTRSRQRKAQAPPWPCISRPPSDTQSVGDLQPVPGVMRIALNLP